MNEVMFSSKTDLWSTPIDFFNRLDKQYNFTLDVCATQENAKCTQFFTKDQDGLAQIWTGVCWMNPPYGRTIGKWIKKAKDSSDAGATVVCLLPARVDTKWFHELCLPYASKIEFVKGRLKFGGSKDNAPFPSMVVVLKN